MAEDPPCTCSGAWFEPPCEGCAIRNARATITAYESRPPKPEAEVDRLRREVAELKAEVARLSDFVVRRGPK